MIKELLIKGIEISAPISLIIDVIKEFKCKSISAKAAFYDTENRKVDMDNLIITYKKLKKDNLK